MKVRICWAWVTEDLSRCLEEVGGMPVVGLEASGGIFLILFMLEAGMSLMFINEFYSIIAISNPKLYQM